MNKKSVFMFTTVLIAGLLIIPAVNADVSQTGLVGTEIVGSPATTGASTFNLAGGDLTMILGCPSGCGGFIAARDLIGATITNPAHISFHMQVPHDDGNTNFRANQNFIPTSSTGCQITTGYCMPQFFDVFTQAGTTYMLDCNGLKSSFGDDLADHAYVLTMNWPNTYTVTKDGSAIGGTWSSSCYGQTDVNQFVVAQNYFSGAPNQKTEVIYTQLFVGAGSYTPPPVIFHQTNPQSGSVHPTGLIHASATIISDPTGRINHFHFVADGGDGSDPSCNITIYVGPPPAEGYGCDVTVTSTGSDYAMFAYAIDSMGNPIGTQDNASPLFTVTNTPTLHITQPVEAQTYPSGTLQVIATLSDPAQLTDHITFTTVTGGHTCTVNVAGFVGPPPPSGWSCNMTGMVPSSYQMTATARDASNNVIVTANNSPHFTIGVVAGITFAASRTVVGGLGFHVDPAGATIITRQTSGATGPIITYAGGGNMAMMGSQNSNCNRQHGVFSAGTHVLYLACEVSDAGVTRSYNIRSPGLGDPTLPPVCSGVGDFQWCIQDIMDASSFGQGALAGNHDHDRHLQGFEDFPITYANNQQGGSFPPDDQAVWMAFAFSTTDGNIGVVTYTMLKNAVDQSAVASASVSSQTPDEICEIRDTTGVGAGNSYLYAASSISNVNGYRVTFTNSDSQFAQHLLTPHLELVFPGTANTAGAKGVACGDGKLAIANTNALTIWSRGAISPTWTIPLSSTPDNAGVAMSADGKWVAVSMNQGSTVNVYDANTGNYSVTLSNPSASIGTFVGMGYQGHGCSLWTMNQGELVRYNLVGPVLPCKTDMSFTPPASGNGGNTATTVTSGAGGVVAGSGCGDHYFGPIRIGFTYVPILDWSNCASMATETSLTILLLVGAIAIMQVRANNGQMSGIGGTLLLVVGALAYMVSMYVWQAPLWFLVAAVALAVGGIFLARPGKSAGS